MKILQVVPKAKTKSTLKALLKAKERELRGTSTTFVRQHEGRWRHKKYQGWINWEGVQGGILIAEVRTPNAAVEWRLLQAFIGYLDRLFSSQIESISISYR
jgi:hypothetical protein